MSNIVFEDYSVQVKNAIEDLAFQFLHEVGGELKSLTKRNSRRKTSETADSYRFKTDRANLCVHVGSDHENAIWEEFGTGEYAINGDGRKGWWVYVKGSPSKASSTSEGKNYSSPAKAKMAVAILKEQGLDAHMTKGKTANRPLFKAFESSKSAIIRRAEEIFGGLN